MPYTPQQARQVIDEQLQGLDVDSWTPGDLTYAIFKIMDLFGGRDEESYARRAQTIGYVGEGIAEWRRQRVVPYEEKKIGLNGAIAPPPPRNADMPDEQADAAAGMDLDYGHETEIV